MLENILRGIVILTTWQNFLFATAGVALGISFGALPGFTAAMGIAVFIPLTYGLDPVNGLVLLGALYCGAIYGGAIAAILLHTPGTPASAATALDGYEMTKQGRASEAMIEAICSSFWGGVISFLALLLIAPPLARAALRFGPPEKFFLAVFGMTIIASLSDDIIKGVISGLVGLLIGTVGMDPLLGTPRFHFGIGALLGGVTLVPALIGLFSISQVFVLASRKGVIEEQSLNTAEQKFSLKDLYRYPKVYIRSSFIGTFVGMIPGAGSSIAAFIGYNEGKRFSKNPEEYGKGSREGLGAAESANNAITGGSLITLLTLGIPGNSVTAVFLGGLMLMGLRPGPRLFAEQAHIAYPFILSLFMANVIMLVMALSAGPLFAKIAKVPIPILVPLVGALGVLGSFAVQNNIFDVYQMIFFGLLGYFLYITGFSNIAVVLGIILGPIAESSLHQSIAISGPQNLLLFFLGRPISLLLIIITILSLLVPFLRAKRY